MLQLLKLLIQTQPLILRLLVQSRPLFGGEDLVIGNPWHHAKITWHAAKDAGWDVAGRGSATVTWDDKNGPTPDDSAAAAIAWHADYLDSYLYNPLWWGTGGLDRFKAALLHQNSLIKLHFDDTTSTRQIQVLWKRYLGGTIAGLLWAADRNDVDAARNIVGTGLHALQDFYSHSNWVDDPARRNKTWLEVEPQVREALHLYAGAYEHAPVTQFKPHGKYAFDCAIMQKLVPAALMDAACSAISPLSQTPMCRRWWECKGAASPRPATVAGVPIPPNVVYIEPPGIALDNTWMAKLAVQKGGRDLPDRGQPTATGEKMFGYARDLALKHTTAWLQDLGGKMESRGYGAFWRSVKTEPRTGERHIPPELANMLGRYNGDLEQYEEPWRTPFNFLSAGEYPPDPAGADEGWFLRLDISTVPELLAGTDADIFADVDGASFLLDRMHERTPQGGTDAFRLLEHNDFEAGSQDSYVIGPFRERPRQLALRNSAASIVDVVRGAWNDLVAIISEALEEVAEYLLGLIGGKADYVGTDKRTWSWDELEKLLDTGPYSIELHMWSVATPTEGEYDVRSTLSVEATPTGLRAHVTLTSIYCRAESAVDIGFTPSDEPFVVWLVSSPALGREDGATQTIRSSRTSPFDGVDKGETRAISAQEIVVDVPRYGGLILAAQVWESDLESDEDREELQARFADEYGGREINERSEFLDALGRAVAPNWKVGTLDAYAFLREETVEVTRLVSNRQLNRWVDAGRSLPVPLYGTSLLSLREIARNNLDLTGGFSVVRDIFRVEQIVGTQSLRAKLENVMQ